MEHSDTKLFFFFADLTTKTIWYRIELAEFLNDIHDRYESGEYVSVKQGKV